MAVNCSGKKFYKIGTWFLDKEVTKIHNIKPFLKLRNKILFDVRFFEPYGVFTCPTYKLGLTAFKFA